MSRQVNASLSYSGKTRPVVLVERQDYHLNTIERRTHNDMRNRPPMTYRAHVRCTYHAVCLAVLMIAGFCGRTSAQDLRPNILWIVAEDASPHIGCYGETTIATPALDQLAATGIRFRNAFVTCPVCSPCRSALVTGMYQTTLGAHNHRSQSDTGKGKGAPKFHASYRLPVPTIPQLMQNAGYFTCNSSNGLPNSRRGKTDYNFIWDKSDYNGTDWADRAPGQPFFAQVQLKGGKNRKASQHGTNPNFVQLPPYYPDHPVLRKDWAEYLNSWVQTDRDVAAILKRLDAEEIVDSTAVFFLTDHGISHLRGKQFLYEEGIRVPLIARLPDGRWSGSVRADLVNQLDLAAISLSLAGIDLPEHLQGHDLFSDAYQPRRHIIAARDRCDETVDVIRCIRTKRFKYIRNFLPHLPHAQPNQYKDGKKMIQAMRKRYQTGRLTELQARMFHPARPAEELYNLTFDPHELRNLAGEPEHRGTLTDMRTKLYAWMTDSGDLGLIPEPILEELGRTSEGRYQLLQTKEQRALVPEILAVIDAQYDKDTDALVNGLRNEHPAIRWWAATGLGLSGEIASRQQLEPLLSDSFAGVRVAAAHACGRLQVREADIDLLIDEISNENYLAGMYAIRALEILNPDKTPTLSNSIIAAQQSPYEFTRRIAKRYGVVLESKGN